MGKNVTKSTMVRNALKAVCGEERYEAFGVYADKRSNDTVRVKVQERWGGVITEEERQAITKYVQDNYGIEVTVTAGCSGGRMLHYTAFTL